MIWNMRIYIYIYIYNTLLFEFNLIFYIYLARSPSKKVIIKYSISPLKKII